MRNYTLEGKHLKVIKYPSPILKEVAKDVVNFNDELAELVKNMTYTMYKSPGIGLAAPQVGESIRLFVVDVDFEREEIELPDDEVEYQYKNMKPLVLINPLITKKEGEIVYQEGCLSLPEVYEDIKRFEKITVDYKTVDGESKTLEAEGLLSICIQHEYDHLDGIVFLDYLSGLKKNFYTKKLLKMKKQ